MKHRFNPIANAFRALLIAAVVAVIGAHFLDKSGRLDSVPKASVAADRLEVSPDGASADIVLRVTAGAEDLGPLKVFWIVSLPETARPWEEPRYLAPAQTLAALPAGASADLDWPNTQLPMPLGRYEVTGWVHEILGTDSTQHLAGALVGSFSITRPAPQSLQFDGGWFSQPNGPLLLQKLSIAADSPQNQTVSVEAAVENRGTVSVGGRAFWLVGRFTDPEPYRAPFWHTEWRTIPVLAPGESYTLSWTENIGLPAGTYGMSIWVHSAGPSGFEHSHASLNIPLTLMPNASHVQRSGPPGRLYITTASVPQFGTVHLTLDNQGSQSTVFVAAEVVPDGERYDWHLNTAPPLERNVDVSIPGHAQRTVDLTAGIQCGPDTSLVRVRVYTPEQPRNTESPLDDVLVDPCP